MLNLVFRLPYWAEKNYYTNLRSYNWDWQLYISSLYLKVKFPQCKYITLFDAYHAVDQIDFNYFQNAHEKWCQAPEYLCKLNIPPASTLRLSAHPPLSCYHCVFILCLHSRSLSTEFKLQIIKYIFYQWGLLSWGKIPDLTKFPLFLSLPLSFNLSHISSLPLHPSPFSYIPSLSLRSPVSPPIKVLQNSLSMQ